MLKIILFMTINVKIIVHQDNIQIMENVKNVILSASIVLANMIIVLLVIMDIPSLMDIATENVYLINTLMDLLAKIAHHNA